jgi:hypothetical protein
MAECNLNHLTGRDLGVDVNTEQLKAGASTRFVVRRGRRANAYARCPTWPPASLQDRVPLDRWDRNYSWGKLSFASSYEPVGGFGSGAYTRYTTPVLNALDEISLRCRADPPSSNSLRPDPAVAGWMNR